jgi:hypothetical protein
MAEMTGQMDNESPYAPPQYSTAPDFVRPPGVVKWFKLYCAFLVLVYLAVSAFGVFLLQLEPGDLADFADDPSEIRIQAYAMLIVGPPFAVIYGLAFFLPRRSWAWICGIVLISLTMTSLCCLPAAIPLLIFWVRQDARAYFNMSK